MNSNLTKYDLCVGDKEDGTLNKQKYSGFALLFEGNLHYVVRLIMFPHTWYFLAKNRESQNGYTIYSKCIRNGDLIRFQDPVGVANLNDDIKTHLELKFHLLSQSVFMNLFPSIKN